MIAPTIDSLWSAALGYFFGSIPLSFIIVKVFLDGLDIRTVGSKNVGGRNVIRSFKYKGKSNNVAYTMGLIVAIFDILKGYFAMWLSQYLSYNFGNNDPWSICFAGIFAILGHNWPIWLLSHGGRGVATTLGNLMFFNPIFFLIWLATFFLLSFPLMYSAIVYITSFIVMGVILYFWPWYVSPMVTELKNDPNLGFLSMIMLFGITLVVLSRQKSNFMKIKNGEAKRMKLWKIFQGKADEALK
ncbi:MAG: glycerol-3-phosphate acyltransferase [Candidatus Heimdallarchaeum aukensis]|uniref:Glycerol-3-phosphate acyltransferase n=1 Tax=Candidatus Heimdallarchaeum aukensis TaxID=2876573 RepID=A0A9Y1BLI9_9ARCH|nr:MAG: glycerol-3-phosphate acyltransferase [Candidatus Heimdallarchaeum aukensis]